MTPEDIKKPMFQAQQRHWTREKMDAAVAKIMVDPSCMHPSDWRDLTWHQHVYINALETLILTNQADENSGGRFGEGVIFDFEGSATGLY